MFNLNRDQLRGYYLAAWQKHLQGHTLDALEAQIVAVIAQHPEYHAFLAQGETALTRDFLALNGDQNPFLHMGLHLALNEQVATDRPAGIRALFQLLVAQCGDAHQAEHRAHTCLADALWLAQQHRTMPDEQVYMACLRRLVARTREG